MTKDEIYIKYLEKLRSKLIAKYDELGLRASGKYADELEYKVIGDRLIMLGTYHSQFMEHGRDAGGFPPKSAIIEWIETKSGLPQEFRDKKDQFAFLIARKIATEGIKVPNEFNRGAVISSVVDDFLGNDIRDMLDELGVVYLNRIKSDVIQIFKMVA